MGNINNYQAYIKAVSSGGNAGNSSYPVSTTQSTIIGRDPSCQIVLNAVHYQGVSRQHVEIRPLMASAADGSPLWQVCDLGSANGTGMNGKRLRGCQTLQNGDRIQLGRNGPEFVFECQPINNPNQTLRVAQPIQQVATPALRPPKQPAGTNSFLHLSQILPVISTKNDLLSKAYLIPGILTVVLVVGLFVTMGTTYFNYLLALYLSLGGFYFIYRLSGKNKPWWLLVSSTLVTALLLFTPVFGWFEVVFRQILPGNVSDMPSDAGFITVFIRHFFGAGLLEELFKAIPIFAALLAGIFLSSPWRERIGVWEPLDGILLGAASAVGFTLVETMFQYVPNMIVQYTEQYGAGAGQWVGLQLLIPRVIGSVAGHMAYSGYFGYFIGLSMLKPSKAWALLGIGYLTSSFLHGFWNASGTLGIWVMAIAGVLSYVFLVAAILKARQLSPTRSQNFATQYRPTKVP